MRISKKPYHAVYNRKRALKNLRRLRKKAKRRKGWFKYYFVVVETAKRKGKKLKKSELPYFEAYSPYKQKPLPEPELSDTIKFLAQHKEAFSKKSVDIPDDGIFKVPNPFSLTENYPESFLFLKKLFFALYHDKLDKVFIDYEQCERIDLDASVCMDILLGEFISYIENSRRRGYLRKIDVIKPINYVKEPIRKTLFSIGAFANIRGVKIKFKDITPFYLLVGDNLSPQKGADQEIEVTKIGDYIVECLDKMGYPPLSSEEEDNFAKVIGEVLINATEHSGGKNRYSIGYLQEVGEGDGKIGVFNLVIFDFGNTIYQNFKRDDLRGTDVVNRMTELSTKYTSSGLFKSKEFEEETLWTLYALQDGVTSVKDRKRGHGTMRFIESFFNLKGDMAHDNLSSLTLLSGNTRITFDGTYTVNEVVRGKEGRKYKMVTFNESGNIEDPPDKRFVSFTDNFFPGTMIVAKICIKFKNGGI